MSLDPVAERARTDALRAYDVLDTPRDANLDKITALAAELFDTPMAAISLIQGDRQWLKSWVGDVAQAMPRSQSFRHHALQGAADGATLLVEDARLDPAFSANPLVTRDGHALGAMCVLDTRAHPEVDARSKPFVTEDLQAVALRWTGRPTTVGAPACDNPVLDDLTAQIGAGAIRSLLAGLDVQMQQVLAASPQAEPAELSRLAHSLRGAAGSLGYGDAARACQAVEAAHRDGASIEAPFLALQAACAAAREAMEQRLAA